MANDICKAKGLLPVPYGQYQLRCDLERGHSGHHRAKFGPALARLYEVEEDDGQVAIA